MDLKEYLTIIRNCLKVIRAKYEPENTDSKINCGIGLSYDFIHRNKSEGRHCDYMSFKYDCVSFTTEIGVVQLYGKSLYSLGKIQREEIVKELGLILKKRKIYDYNSFTNSYEHYYVLPDLPYHNIHSYQEIIKVWESINV